MQNYKFTSYLTLLVFMSALASVYGGAWPREKNELYSKISYSNFSSDQTYQAKGNKKAAGPDFTDQTISLYNEYGFTDSFTGILTLNYKALDYDVAGIKSKESGLADAWVYLKKSILKEPFVLSFQGGAKFPLGYDDQAIPPLGQGQIDVEERVLVGKSFYPLPLYANAEIGFRKRMGDYSDELPFRIEGGWSILKSLLLKVSLDGISNRSNDAASKTSNRAPNVFDQEYMKFSPGLIFFLPHNFALDIYYESVVSGGNTAAGDTIGIGVSWLGKIRNKNQ
jgi:hypothetical protein